MADIITYPENGVTYDADDAAGYLATRISGVYSSEEDYAVTATGDLTVTVSAGQAWVRPARFRGRSIIMEQPETVTLPAADAVRSRIDRVVLRYDAAAQRTTLTVLTGTPDSTSPAAPEITRTALVYDLGLAEIRRPAGSTAVTTADITDTRADEAVCGLMRDGVTGIPTAQLIAQWNAALAAQVAGAGSTLDALLDSYSGGYLASLSVTLAASAWTAGSGTYPYSCTADLALCRAEHVPVAVFALDSLPAAEAAGVAPLCETLAGGVRFYARARPERDLTVQVSLLGPWESYSGTRLATDDEASAMLDDIYKEV